MAEIIRMPRLSDTMEEGNIIGWMKKVGDVVEPGDVLAEVETDKATMELESFQNGTILYIGISEGVVPVDGIIAIIGDKGEDYKAQLKEAQEQDTSSQAKEEVVEVVEPKKKEIAITPKAPKKAVAVVTPVIHSPSSGRIKISPLAKQLAKEGNVDVTGIQGSGDSGRIIKKDIEAYIANPRAFAPQKSPALALPDVEYGSQAVSQMRKVIARRLGESKFSAPHFYLTVEVNMDMAMVARKGMNEMNNFKVSFNDLIVKASAHALRYHPYVNSSWLGDTIEVHQEINIGVAVAIPEGLMVPVLKNVDTMNLGEINSQVKLLAGKARDKKLQPDEMQGNTFTISNLGMLGIEEFTAIINPPDACILAVGAIIQKPIVKDGEIVVGNMMKLTLSCDHRVVDGAKGSEFLGTLKKNLENPFRFLT